VPLTHALLRAAGPLALAAAALATGGCGDLGCAAGSDAAPPPDGGAPMVVAIGTVTDGQTGFRLLADGDTLEVVLGQQGGTMTFLRYVVPADETSTVAAAVHVEIAGFPAFDRGPWTGTALPEPGADGLVTAAHRVIFSGDLGLPDVVGASATLTVNVTDDLGRSGTASVNVVLHDDVMCQDFGPGECLPYGDSGAAIGSDAGDAGL
jgi:hypothetical protein